MDEFDSLLNHFQVEMETTDFFTKAISFKKFQRVADASHFCGIE